MGLLVPEEEESISLRLKSITLCQQVFNGTRDSSTWAKLTETFRVGPRPVSCEPVRAITAAHKPGDNNRFVHFIRVALACCPEGVCVEERHKVCFKIN